MDPNPNRDQAERKIRDGKREAWNKSLEASSDWVESAGYTYHEGHQGFIWKFQDLFNIIIDDFKLTLTNSSSVATYAFLKPIIREIQLKSYSRESRERRRQIRSSQKTLRRTTYGHQGLCLKKH